MNTENGREPQRSAEHTEEDSKGSQKTTEHCKRPQMSAVEISENTTDYSRGPRRIVEDQKGPNR